MFKELFEADNKAQQKLIDKLTSKNGKVVDFRYNGMDNHFEIKVKAP